MTITYQPIGVVRSPFDKIEGVPIQSAGATGIEGTVEINPEYRKGLQDLEGFSHIILIYHFHRVRESELMVTPFLDVQPRGVPDQNFSTDFYGYQKVSIHSQLQTRPNHHLPQYLSHYRWVNREASEPDNNSSFRPGPAR